MGVTQWCYQEVKGDPWVLTQLFFALNDIPHGIYR